MVEIAVMLVAAARGVVIPDAERHPILMGCTAYILEIVVAEVVVVADVVVVVVLGAGLVLPE